MFKLVRSSTCENCRDWPDSVVIGCAVCQAPLKVVSDGELDLSQVFSDICTELGCKNDNEAALERIAAMRSALKEAERFMAYFSGETGGHFVGPGMPTECLAQIREAIGPAAIVQ